MPGRMMARRLGIEPCSSAQLGYQPSLEKAKAEVESKPEPEREKTATEVMIEESSNPSLAEKTKQVLSGLFGGGSATPPADEEV